MLFDGACIGEGGQGTEKENVAEAYTALVGLGWGNG